MRINNNLSAISAYNALDLTNTSLQKIINALSSGLRINSSSDDAAGFAISEKMRSQIRGLDVALRNSQDGISLLQTAEGALGSTNSMLHRMRELAVQASNDTLTSNDRQYIQLEIDELRDEIDRVAETTQFNRKRLLDGSCGAIWSSSDLNVNVKINGGLTYIDNYGQKVSAEGNYRIDVRAEAGEAQIQKSNILNTVSRINYTAKKESKIESKIIGWTEKIIVEDVEMNWSIAINGGDNGEAVSTIKDAPNADEINSGWSFNAYSKEVTIKENGIYHITGNISVPTQNHIVIAEGVEASIILEDVNIDVSNISEVCAFDIKPGAKANIFLAGTNTLKSGYGRAGIEVRGAANSGEKTASVVINSANSSDSSSLDGFLNVTGGDNAAAIGGPGNVTDGMSGSIKINGGTIMAKGGTNAAGIGGGTNGNNGGGTITINGGDVTAISPLDGGIGTGINGSASTVDNGGTVITITGGRIKAKGGNLAGAGIGGGLRFGSGIIKIKSGITIIEDEPISESTFLNNCSKHDNNNSGSYVYAVKGASNTAAIGHGRNAQDTPGGIDLNASLPDPVYPDVPDKPSAMVKTPATVLEPIYGDVDVIYNESVEESNVFSTIKEISQFYNSSGTFLVSQPQTLTITQGDGQTASITLYETDTMYDVAEKINNVIANTFGNARYTDNHSKFCTISDGTENTSESIYERNPIYSNEIYKRDENGELVLNNDGEPITLSLEERLEGYEINATMLIRSAKPGKEGELHFSGDEDLLKALGLNTIRESSETRYTASVYNAHSGKVIANGIRTTGNVLSGVIPNIDIEFDSMAGIKSTWDEDTKRYILSNDETYSAYIHLKDNSTILQTGANQGEDYLLELADSSSQALGITSVSVVTRETAAASIGIIDRAIHQVSSQRAKIGAYQNALEQTMMNLTTTGTNLTSAESRIRDADMSKLMMEFVKLQILNQSGTSMLAQANQLPQSVLSLMQ